MAQEQDCRKCVEETGKLWTSSMDSDLDEGICPKAQGEVWTCEKTGQKIVATGRIHITASASLLES
jgi:hypothetical protein